MKKLVCCGISQQKSPSPPFNSTLLKNSPNHLTTDMAVPNNNQGEWYTTVCGTNRFTLPVRYQDPYPVGHGAFGAVIRAKDTETGKYVAIKKMLRPFQTAAHSKRTYRELKLLTELNHPDSQIVQLLNVFTPEPNVNEFRTLYFVFNFVDLDLDRHIKRRIPFSEDQIRHIIYSILCGSKYMHSAGVIHRDLKPTNIGIDKESNVIILDFGLARVQSTGVQTGYVCTRWWRAPEIYISWERYDEKVDIWSIGCIMAELILLNSIFRGIDHISQLNKIFDIIGSPDPAVLSEICTPDTYAYICELPPRPKQDFNALFGYKYAQGSNTPVSGVSEEGVKFLDRLLTFDYRQRPTAEEALKDPFMSKYRDETDEPTAERLTDEHEDANYSVLKWKEIVWQMVQEFLPPSFADDDDITDN